jgi:hypothetical protein
LKCCNSLFHPVHPHEVCPPTGYAMIDINCNLAFRRAKVRRSII